MAELSSMNGLDYLVIACYLAVMVAVGLYAARFNRNTGDYFKAGGNLPWLISGLSLFISGFSAFMFVSASGVVYNNGLSSLWLFTSAFWGYVLGYFFFGKLWHRARLDSPMELLTRRFSHSTTWFYSLATLVPNILLMGAYFYTLSIFISSAMGVNKLMLDLGFIVLSGFELTIISIGIILVLYTAIGGLWAISVTDTIQFVILILMSIIVFPLSFAETGNGNMWEGFQAVWEHTPPGFLDLSHDAGIWYVLAFVLSSLFGYNANWHVGQRYYSISREKDTKKMALLCGILSLVAPLIWILPVLNAKLMFPDLAAIWPELKKPAEAAYVSMCLKLLPHGFLGLVVSALLAATMSSADSTFNWLAAVVVKDVYVPLRKKWSRTSDSASETLQLWIGKLTVIIAGLLAIIIALAMKDYKGSFDIYLDIFSVASTPLLVPVFWGLLWRKTPWWSAIAAALAGILAASIVQYQFEAFQITMFTGVGASTCVFFLSTLWPDTKAEYQARLQSLDVDLQTPRQAVASQTDTRASQSYRLISWISGFIGLLLIILALLPQETESNGFGINLYAGLGALLLGLFFGWISKKL